MDPLARRIRIDPGHASHAAAVLIAALSLACASQEPGNGELRIDTVGSTVFLRLPLPAVEPVQVPILVIGGGAVSDRARPDEFGRVQSAVISRDGTIHVADGHAREVRSFDLDGSFLRSFGRSGSGPGEFRSLQSLGFIGDTLLVLDGGNARISLMTADAEYLSQWQWLPITGPASHVRFYPTGPGENYVPGLNGRFRVQSEGLADTIVHTAPGNLPSPMLRCPVPGGISFFTVPFAPRWIWAPAPQRETASIWSVDYRIVFTSTTGDTLRVIERPSIPISVTDEEWEAATQDYREFRAQNPAATCEPQAMSRPAYHPALQGIYFNQNGWLVVEATTQQGSRYDFYDESGYGRGTVHVPPRDASVAPYFRDRWIVQVAKDSLDVQSVQLFEWQEAVPYNVSVQ